MYNLSSYDPALLDGIHCRTLMNPSDSCRDFRRTNLRRRQILQAGGLGLLGGTLPNFLNNLAASDRSSSVTPKAKACIFLFMWGGPSQLDTFDLKPNAPAEVRGPFKPIATNVPGLQFGEHFTKVATHADKLAVIRSLSHTDPAHLSSGHATVTGHWAPVLNSDRDPPSDRDTPHMGAMIDRVRGVQRSLPNSVVMPWQAYHPAAPGGIAPGQHGGWLGSKYDPMLITGDPNAGGWRVPALTLEAGTSRQRLQSRLAMLQSLDRQRAALARVAETQSWDGHQGRVTSMLTNPDVAEAFDISQEPAAVRDRYGRNIHGQCVLVARRLVEHGVAVVNVNWHNDGRNFWDTHGNNFKRLKNDLIPPADQALAALLSDLSERGMLDETIVAWVGEFGRRPQITAKNQGREHWPHCYTGLLAGGGVRGGATYGESDATAAYPASHPVTPQDYAATIFQQMGVDVSATLNDREGRPHRICNGQPITSIIG